MQNIDQQPKHNEIESDELERNESATQAEKKQKKQPNPSEYEFKSTNKSTLEKTKSPRDQSV